MHDAAETVSQCPAADLHGRGLAVTGSESLSSEQEWRRRQERGDAEMTPQSPFQAVSSIKTGQCHREEGGGGGGGGGQNC
eukprot:132475-Rhodomonas_salina.1